MLTLRQFQQILKPKDTIVFNCSECIKCNDEWVDFTIGTCVHFIRYTGDIVTTQFGPHDTTVLCSITSTTDSRRRPTGINRSSILQTLQANGIQNQKLSYKSYITSLPKYKFVVSPEGNGIDCHRHYEALLAGCIPIVEENDLIKEKYSGCPILYTKDYSEITKEYLDNKYESMIDQAYDFSKLNINFYSKEVQDKIKSNGNFWSKRFYGKRWYK